VLPHAGGGGETYVDMLAAIPGYSHERFYLSAGRTAARGAVSIPVRWPALAARARGAELVHVHGDAAGAIALPLMRSRPTVVTTHGLHLLRRSRGLGLWAIQLAMRTVVAGARAVICTSAAERTELLDVARAADHGKLRVIANAVTPWPAGTPTERQETRDRLGIGDQTVLGLFAGQLEPRKAPLLAAAAARRARAAGVDFVLVLAGDGPQAADLQALASEAVRPVGYRDDLHRLSDAADVFVAPAEREGLSLALLEAMASGLTIIASDGPGNPEAVGDTGLLFPVGDERAFAEAIVRLARDRDLRASLGARARERALTDFSPERFRAQTAEVYRETVKPVLSGARGDGQRPSTVAGS
jgi:glycosyltransferase involved in cell wall biosynthesis